MNEPSPLLQQCFSEVLDESPRLLGRCLEAMIQALIGPQQRTGDGLVADTASAAWSGLMRHRPTWVRAFPQRLRDAFERGDDSADSGTIPLQTDSAHLALVDEADYNEQIEFKRMLQQLQPLVEHELAALDARMSSLVGLSTVHADRNPLRPSVMARELYRLMQASEPDREVRSRWLRQLAVPLGTELRQLYATVALRLQQADVQEAGYRVRLVSDPTGPRVPDVPEDSRYGLTTEWFDLPGAEPMATGPAGPAPAFVQSDLAACRSSIDPDIYHRFLAESAQTPAEPLTGEYHRAVERAWTDLRSAMEGYVHDEAEVLARRSRDAHLPAVDRPARQVDTDTPLPQSVWGEFALPHVRSQALLALKRQARRIDQPMGLDVVRMLVNQVARDPLLLAPLREAVIALEPALLRLALDDPRYFGQTDHPARRLIESVAQRSFRFNDEFATDFQAFMRPVAQGFTALLERPAPAPADFARVLSALQASWALLDAREHEQRERSLQAARRADERQNLADAVVRELSQRPDIDHAPAFLVEFLYGPWALVIASAALDQPGVPDPQGYRKAVSDLIWSIRRDVTMRLPARLFDILPGLLQTLRGGLARLEQDEAAFQPFFETLMRLHEPVLRLRRARVRRTLGEASARELPVLTDALPPASPEQRQPREAEQPWLAPAELAATGFEDTQAQEDTRGETPPDLPQEPGQAVPTPVPARMATGEWFDLFSGGEWLRAQLVWASARGTLYMFISRGGRSHSMTRRTCDRLLRERLLRPVGSREVVLQALQAVAGELPRRRGDAPGLQEVADSLEHP
ncbi:DUF1631 family protein [uncultured Hydrogenophaga sp.]|uniref:DUF1631 family protein n=1 Tax=uncultured Hydrogenophaga sp. TaxID=199683 RepID=UPI00265EE710|nr:DUF1631 family protein [uncultured Hydrogenophaga sp.]